MKVLIIGLLLIAAWYAYGHVKIDTVTVCVEKQAEALNVTCVEDADCVKYLTSVYGTYPDTPMYRLLVDASSSCDVGRCQMKAFEFKDTCVEGEFPVVYKVTAKELVSTR